MAAGGAGGPFGGRPDWRGCSTPSSAAQVSWLIPLAVAGLVGGLCWTWRVPARTFAGPAWSLWGGWALATMAVFSDAQGIFHPYYAVPSPRAWPPWPPAAPRPVAARSSVTATRPPAPGGGGQLRIWAVALLGRTPGYDPGLSTVILVGAVLSAVVLLLVLIGVLRARWVGVLAGTVAAASLLAGPAAFSLTTVNQSAGTGATRRPARPPASTDSAGSPAAGSPARRVGSGRVGDVGRHRADRLPRGPPRAGPSTWWPSTAR